MGGQGNRLPELGLCQSTQAAPSGSRLSNRVPPEALGGQPVPAAWAGGGGHHGLGPSPRPPQRGGPAAVGAGKAAPRAEEAWHGVVHARPRLRHSSHMV